QALNASRPLKSRTRITVKEIQIAGADTSVVLGIETHFPDDPITLTQRGEGGAPQTGTLRLSGSLSGEQVYSLQRSAQVRAMMGGTIKMKSGTAGQPETTMAMTQQTSLQLTEAKCRGEARAPRRPAPRLPSVRAADAAGRESARGRRRRRGPPRGGRPARATAGSDRTRGRHLSLRPPDQSRDSLPLPAAAPVAGRSSGRSH